MLNTAIITGTTDPHYAASDSLIGRELLIALAHAHHRFKNASRMANLLDLLTHPEKDHLVSSQLCVTLQRHIGSL